MSKIGGTKFTEQISQMSLNFDSDQFQCNRWYTFSGEPEENRINSDIFPKIEKSNVQKIDSYGNLNPLIIKQMINIKFTSLLELRLGNNNIVNIEAIADIKAPHLKGILLNENSITSVRSMRKTRCKKLKNVSLWNNPICELHQLRQWKTPHLQSMYFQVRYSTMVVCQNILSVLHTFQSNKLHLIKIDDLMRITTVYMDMLSLKNPQLEED